MNMSIYGPTPPGGIANIGIMKVGAGNGLLSNAIQRLMQSVGQLMRDRIRKLMKLPNRGIVGNEC